MSARLTFPAYDVGAADILADGESVGFCLAEFWCWRAYLYPAAQDRRIRTGKCEEVTAGTLRDLRRLLRERVDGEGPWWAPLVDEPPRLVERRHTYRHHRPLNLSRVDDPRPENLRDADQRRLRHHERHRLGLHVHRRSQSSAPREQAKFLSAAAKAGPMNFADALPTASRNGSLVMRQP